MTPLHDLSISELAPRLAAREVSSLEVTEACLSRIATDNGRVNAFISEQFHATFLETGYATSARKHSAPNRIAASTPSRVSRG